MGCGQVGRRGGGVAHVCKREVEERTFYQNDLLLFAKECFSYKPHEVHTVSTWSCCIFVLREYCHYVFPFLGGVCTLTEDRDILNRWTEYCSELYNHKAKGDPEVLKHPPVTNIDSHPILREEVEAAVKSPGKSAGVDNIPAELLQAGEETMIDVLLNIYNKIWQTGEWPTPWTQSLVITLPKKGNLLQCQNYRTISLISHASKVMLKILLNRLTPQAEMIIAEEQAGYGPGRNTTAQIFSLRILCERYLQHQQDLFHVFVDFKKAFDRVWHVALWSTMELYNINANLIKVIESLYSSILQWQCGRMVQDNRWSETGMSAVTYSF